MIGLVVAFDANYGIGKKNKIPWHISADLQRFKALTLNSTVIMGRNTWESMGSKPLKNRQNIIVSSTMQQGTLNDGYGTLVVDCVPRAVNASIMPNIFFIGGNKIYLEALDYAEVAFLTSVNGEFDCDAFFPMKEFEEKFVFYSSTTHLFEKTNEKISYDFLEYVKKK